MSLAVSEGWCGTPHGGVRTGTAARALWVRAFVMDRLAAPRTRRSLMRLRPRFCRPQGGSRLFSRRRPHINRLAASRALHPPDRLRWWANAATGTHPRLHAGRYSTLHRAPIASRDANDPDRPQEWDATRVRWALNPAIQGGATICHRNLKSILRRIIIRVRMEWRGVRVAPEVAVCGAKSAAGMGRLVTADAKPCH